MDGSSERWTTGVLSGDDRSIGASALRGVLALAEPMYAGLMTLRNAAYDRRIFESHPLPRPTVSVGNLTTGGTGKTPVVRWLADRFIARGLRPAVLLRGYRGDQSGESDEQRMLADALPGAIVVANPNRLAGAMSALLEMSQPDLFVLDDAFQHRHVKRDFDLVLIDATAPFGFGHVLPRGLLREPMRGLHRADAIVVTRSDQVTSQELGVIESSIRRHRSAGSIDSRSTFTRDCGPARHRRRNRLICHWRSCRASASSALPASPIRYRCGGNSMTLASAWGSRLSQIITPTAPADLARIRQQAGEAGSELLVTTEKDWVKIRQLPGANDGLPILRLELAVEFREDDDDRLVSEILARIKGSPAGLPRA